MATEQPELKLNLRTRDSLACDQEVVLSGDWTGVVERSPDAFDGCGEIVIRLRPTDDLNARMQVGPTTLHAHQRITSGDLVWRDTEPDKRGRQDDG